MSGAGIASRLFWRDPYLKEFQASVVRKLQYSNKPAVILDQTAFYATNGGQPNDIGAINNAKVVDVIEDKHDIIHVLDRELEEAEGASVTGSIDWGRRQDHMQQHHGQHILSKAFIDVANASTLSFHLGKDVCYIDLDQRDLTEEQMRNAMHVANKIVYSNLPVKTSFHTLEEAKKLPLRKLDAAVVEPVRIVQVGDFDLQACCGTHPSSTGQVQSVAIVNYEKIKKTTRLFFVCGLRAVDLLFSQSLAIKRIGVKLTAPAEHEPVEKAIDQLITDFGVCSGCVGVIGVVVAPTVTIEQALRKTSAENEKIIAKVVAAEIVQKGGVEKESGSPIKIYNADLSDRDVNYIKNIAKNVIATPNSIIAFYAKAGSKEPTTVNFVIGASPELTVDLRPLLKDTFSVYPGKGGGDQKFVQGNYPNVTNVNALVELVVKKLQELK